MDRPVRYEESHRNRHFVDEVLSILNVLLAVEDDYPEGARHLELVVSWVKHEIVLKDQSLAPRGAVSTLARVTKLPHIPISCVLQIWGPGHFNKGTWQGCRVLLAGKADG